MPYKDKEKARENKRQYRLNHKESITTYMRQYNIAHQKEIAINKKEWRAEHKENGLCIYCNQPISENSKICCLFHLDRGNRTTKKSHNKLEIRVMRNNIDKIEYYKRKSENKCVMCGMPLNEESRMGIKCLNCYTLGCKSGY